MRDYIDYISLSVPHGPPPYRKFGGPHTRRLGLEAGPGGSIREVGSLKAVLQRSENCKWKGLNGQVASGAHRWCSPLNQTDREEDPRAPRNISTRFLFRVGACRSDTSERSLQKW